jgi:hypothetical protein
MDPLTPPEPRRARDGSRRGANIDLFGADFTAERARSGMVPKYLIADGLVESSKKWSPSTWEMYEKNVWRRAAAKARAGKALKHAARLDARRLEAENDGAS